MNKKATRRWWTDEDQAWLIALYPHERCIDVAFALGCTVGRVYAKAHGLGLHKTPEFLAAHLAASGRHAAEAGKASRFVKGQKAWNKGLHYQPGGRIKESQYKPGNISGRAAQLVQPIGSYRINSDGYLDRKVADTPGPNHLRWKPVHRLVWEAARGPVSAGHIVVFKPGMRTAVLDEITVERLELITRVENMRRNSYHTRYPKELGILIQLRGALQRQINKRTRHEQDD